MGFIPADTTVAVSALLALGFSVGVCGGFFGIGGAFIVTPALNILGFPMVYAIGTDMAHMAGKSASAALRHRRAGFIDYQAAGLLMLGTIPGVKLGSVVIQALEVIGKTDSYVRAAYTVLLFTVGFFMLKESRRKQRGEAGSPLACLSKIKIPPFVNLKKSGIDNVSIWVVIGLGLLTGFLAGFLGVGGGFIRMPALIYLLGMPAKIAVGTDLVEVLVSGGYGAYLYGKTGHVDLPAALIMLVGAAIGSQAGAVATQYVESDGIKRLFAVTILGTGVAVAMKQAHLNTVAAIVLLGLGFVMTITILRRLSKSLAAQAEKELR